MVKNNRSNAVSSYVGSGPPANEAADFQARRIRDDRPLYPQSTVEQLLADHGRRAIVGFTVQCGEHLQALSLDLSDLYEIVKHAIATGRYKNSQWCIQSPKGPWIAADAYLVTVNSIDLYLKFAINKKEDRILVVSCHETKYGD